MVVNDNAELIFLKTAQQRNSKHNKMLIAYLYKAPSCVEFQLHALYERLLKNTGIPKVKIRTYTIQKSLGQHFRII